MVGDDTPGATPDPDGSGAVVPAPVSVALEPIVYAVGDIHGMDSLLDDLLLQIEADAARRGRPVKVVFLGDLVNRGPDSRQVVERIMAGPRRPDHSWLTVAGNHEQLMLDALLPGSPLAFRRWMKKGGRETLRSYGVPPKQASLDAALKAVPREHLVFLAGLPQYHLHGEFLFVHAGVEPGVRLEAQRPQSLLTIRGPFFKEPHGLPFVVVHGHTPTEGRPLVGPDRIGVDTGAAATGILTALAIDGETPQPRFIQARARPSRAARRQDTRDGDGLVVPTTKPRRRLR